MTLFSFFVKSNLNQTFTKRSMLSIINSIYDPLGLINPFTIRAKILMRKLWAQNPKIDWDDNLPKEIEQEWEEILLDMNDLN